MIDWSKLEAGHRGKTDSFEELCYQLAKGIYGADARFVSVDDRGGGDGVEFYATFPNGRQWGWQAKFFYPDVRLTGSRKTQIKRSLQRACEVHPDLTDWFLCMPADLTPTEREWFEDGLHRSRVNGRPTVPKGRRVELRFWGHSDLLGWLSEERFAGKRLYFFGELELSMRWFREQFEKQVSGVREKYERSLHTETHDDQLLHALLGDERFADEFARRLGVLRQDLTDFDRWVGDLVAGKPGVIDWGDKCEPLVEAAGELRSAIAELVEGLAEIHERLSYGDLDLVRQSERVLSSGPLLDRIHHYRALEEAVDVSALPYAGPPNKEEESRGEAERTLSLPVSYAAEIHDGARQMMSLLGYLHKSDLHVLGDAGDGKTHLACWICDRRISNGLPAIFLPGAGFTAKGGLERQMRDLLDIPPSRSWGDFLKALDSAAQAHRTRIPVVIDGLNEAVRNGAFSTVWSTHLSGLVEEISRTPNVALLTTSRTSYRTAIWPDEGMPENVTFVDGFGFYEVEEAIGRYFAAYKIRADLTAAPLEQFEHPIYLKLFCEAKNPQRLEVVDVHVGDESLFEVFDQYLARCDAEAVRLLGLRPGIPAVSLPLQKVASYLWHHRSRSVPLPEAVRLVDGKEVEHLRWPTSKTHAMESEGLLVCRDRLGEGESYVVTYDLMAGYLIARRLLDEHDDLAEFLNSDDASELLYAEDSSKRHPLHEDIRRALAALAPKLRGQHLHELTDDDAAVSDSLHALFEIAPEHVGESGVRLVTERFAEVAYRQRLLDLSYATLARPGHPLNADYWHERLRELPLPERDLSWSERVRRYQGRAGILVDLLEQRCREPDQHLMDNADRSRLLAKHAIWVLTSTVKNLRDKATRALYWYGRRFPDGFFALVEESLEIDDPYVPERTLAACYGIAMARRYEPADRGFVEGTLPRWAEALYTAMFAPGAPHATPHILARNYARRTIEVACLHHPDVLTKYQIRRAMSPYEDGGLREWGHGEAKREYRDGGHPFNPLEDDPMGQLGPGISKYHPGEAEYREAEANLWWRVYDLGYSFDAFASVDARIRRETSHARHYDHDRSWTESYGRKYVRIATLELAGHRDDLGLLRSDYDWEVNPPHVDLDPSFPEKPPELRLVAGDLLGDRDETLGEWISRGPDLTFEDLLELDALRDEPGPWVLLWGDVTQLDKKNRRHMFCILQGVLLEAAEAEDTLNAVDHAQENRLDATDIPEVHYAYAGEIPWCETYPPAEPSEITLIMGEMQVATKHFDLEFVRNGESVSNAEFSRLMSELVGDEGDVPETQDEEAADGDFERALQEYGIELVEREITVDERLPVMEHLKMTMPVMRHSFSGSRSDVAPDFSAYVPTRQIAENLNLKNRPQTYDLFDADGRRASLAGRHGGEFSNMQEFVFIRKDLLDHYLAESGQRLAWVIYGERALFDSAMDGATASLGDAPPYIRYGKTRLYD